MQLINSGEGYRENRKKKWVDFGDQSHSPASEQAITEAQYSQVGIQSTRCSYALFSE